MPGMDGLEMCRRLKEDDKTRAIPIIFISALGDETDKVKGFHVGGVDYITKPFSPDEVLARIRTHLTLELTRLDLECRTAELETKNETLAREIEERKMAEKALRESEAQKKAILDGITSNIAFVNKDLEIIWLNKTAADSTGKTPTEMIGRKCHSFWADPDKPCEGCPTLRAFDTKKSEMTTIVTPDGRVWDEKGEPVFDEAGNLIGVVEIAEDITDRVREEKENEMLKAQLFQSQKLEALGTLVGGIAHDFNNMLQIIIGYADFLLIDKAKGAPGHKELQIIIDAGQGGAELVKKLLAFGQQAQVIPRPIDLNEQIRSLATLISRTLPNVVQLDLDLAEGPTTIRAERGQIEQLFMNLAINASEAMPNGGRLKISTETVSLNDEYCRRHNGVQAGSYVMLMVSDTGRGMDKETLARIFDPFFSTKQRGSTRGTGLGLSVVQGIVQQHGGHVTCESEPGKGTEFKVRFPSIETSVISAKTIPPKVQSAGTETVLVVEDNIPVAELERKALRSAGYNVILANNGKDALDIYRTRKEEISLLILDLLLPKMLGRDCLMELLKIDPSVKVLIASGYAPEDQLHREISSLVKGFIQKPFGMAELLEAVKYALGDGR
jgi:PAS domain S-box-containing protein